MTKLSNFIKNMKIKKETLKVIIKKKREQHKQKLQETELYSTEFSKEFGDLESELTNSFSDIDLAYP